MKIYDTRHEQSAVFMAEAWGKMTNKMVEAIGGKGYFGEDPKDIRQALEDAFASGKVCCINVMVDPTTVSPASMALANVGAYKA